MNITNRQPPVPIERCPYLGLHDDSSTSLAYPSPWNYCYHATPPASILIAHQVDVCLSPHYADCSLMLSNKWGRLPRQFRGRAGGQVHKNQLPRVLLPLVLVGLLVIFLILVFFPGGSFLF